MSHETRLVVLKLPTPGNGSGAENSKMASCKKATVPPPGSTSPSPLIIYKLQPMICKHNLSRDHLVLQLLFKSTCLMR